MPACDSNFVVETGHPFKTALAVLEDGLHATDHVPEVQWHDLARWHVAVRLRLHDSRAPAAPVSQLWVVTADCALFSVRRNGEIAGAMRLTNRCMEILKFSNAARWSATGQIWQLFFRERTLDAARRWLRKATSARYLRQYREN